MCQYSAVDGCMTSWHAMHLGQLALSGAGLLTIEAAAVSPEGRITYADVGLYDNACEQAMTTVLETVRAWSSMPIAIQLAHAGRKASTEKPWLGGSQFPSSDANGWATVAPSAVPFRAADQTPRALTLDEMERIKQDFVAATWRTERLGIDAIQLHSAHGYLLHQFLSPLANQRTDEYGGSLENRMRYPLEVFKAVRDAFPADKPVSVRISGTDWVEGGWTIEESIVYCQALAELGCAAINVSSGGLHEAQKIPVAPGYQVPLARAIKQAVDIPVVAVGLITDFEHAEAIVATGDPDMVGIARGILYDPHWPWHAAAHLGATVKAPPQYLRSQPRQYRDLLVQDTPAG